MIPSLQERIAAVKEGDPVLVNTRTNRIIPYLAPAPGREPAVDRNDLFTHTADGWVKSMATHYADECPPGLWRIHGELYDLSAYLDTHPGGRIFLQQTRGSDCTESFECHHVRGVSDALMNKFRVSSSPLKGDINKADRFTYKQYREMRVFVAEFLKTKLKNPTGKTPHWAGCLYTAAVFQFLFLARLAAQKRSYLVACIAGLLLTGCWGVGHNQVHRGRKTGSWWNLLRYAMDLTGWSNHDATVTHAMSHHQNANLYYDIEIFTFQDIGLFWLTNERRNTAWPFKLGAFVLLAGFTSPVLCFQRMTKRLFVDRDPLNSDVLIPSALIAYMARTSGSWRTGLGLTFAMWYVHSATFIPGSLALHHAMDMETGAPRCYHDGEDDFQRDFAAHQIVATLDHSKGMNDYLALELFAHLNVHTIHHLFPTVDRVLHEPILEALIKENPGGFRDIYEKRNKTGKNFWTDLLPSVFRFTMDRGFIPQ